MIFVFKEDKSKGENSLFSKWRWYVIMWWVYIGVWRGFCGRIYTVMVFFVCVGLGKLY